jgi:hypothetical protein
MSEFEKSVFSIVQTTAEDKQIVIEFLRKFFFRDEPLILSIDMLEDIDSLAKLENYCFQFVDNGELNCIIYKAFLCILIYSIHNTLKKLNI